MQDRVGLEAPGQSLIQGSDSIHINMALHRQEEEEEQEDLKRRNGESYGKYFQIKDLLTHAFDDLENEDDASSVNSSHIDDASRGADHSSITNCSIQSIVNDNDKGRTLSQYQIDFGMYATDGITNCAKSTPYTQHSDANKESAVSSIEKEFGVYGQLGTSLNNNKENSSSNLMAESLYELPRPPSITNPTSFPYSLRAQINDGYTLLDNYSVTYNTPSNHYDGIHNKNYPNNGYIGSYDNSTPQPHINENHEDHHEHNSEHVNHCYKTSPNGRPVPDLDAYNAADYNSKEQLMVLYSVRMREIKQLTEENQQLRMEKEDQHKEFTRKLTLAQADLERCNFSKNQAQSALVDAKAEIIELQSQAESFKEKIAVLNKANENMSKELSTARESVVDLQQKIAILERVQSLQRNDKTHEKFLKQMQEKHSIEMKNMQTQIDILTEKLNRKESECVGLEHKLSDARRTHEALLVEKGDTMNRLAQALEESQEQCRNLMASNNTHELTQLQSRIKLLNEDKDRLLATVQELQHKLDVAKSDMVQYDSLLAQTLEDNFDSNLQLKLGERCNKTRNNMFEETAEKLRGELQRCMAGQAVKRKEITRLENTLAQKDEELKNALIMCETSQKEAAHYANRIKELEQQLKIFITKHSVEATNQIQQLSDHLVSVGKQKDTLMCEKQELEQKLEETLANQEDIIRKVHQETMAQQESIIIDEYNKEYLRIHEKAINRVKQDAQAEIVQLTVQLEQTQKELDRVKELYIDVCSTKEDLISEHENEIKMLKETYANLEAQKQDMDQIRMELELQKKISNKLTNECESHMKRTIELEKDLNNERKKRAEYTRRVHEEITQAKEEALKKIRNACPDGQIIVPLSDHCSEHSDKIVQLEDDYKRLEEKLSVAVGEQRKMTHLQTELDDTKIKMVQVEMAFVSLKKKYDSILNERNDLLIKLTKQESITENAKKNNEIELAEPNLSKKINLEIESLKDKCDSLLKDKIEYRAKISELEIRLAECKKKVAINVESHDNLSPTRDELEKEVNRYKDLVKQLTAQLNNRKDRGKSEVCQEEKLKQLELELAEKEAQVQRLEDLEKIKDERDQLVAKLKNQAKQFEEYVKNQKQVSAELNLSPRNTVDGLDYQKIREMSRIEVRDEMEQKLAKELRLIEEQYHKKEKCIEENYKSMIKELNSRYAEKTKELQTSFKAQEQIVTHMIETKLSEYRQELLARKLKIDRLEAELVQKESDVEEKKNVMAQAMSKWAAEMQDMETNQAKMQKEIIQLHRLEETLKKEIDLLKDRINLFKHKYQSAKKSSQKYKELAEEKEKFLMGECRRIIEGYNKVMNQVQQNFDDIVNTQEKQVDEKFKEFQSQYDEKLHQVRLQMKYKDK
ncbi:hypothetical protein PV328_010425 [Microctonus aethiopoides]|uniref:Centrosomal protein of 152 kDa n=1 Tax=Microctonus aethiopoides TaxID=144406 RepID=A0AA39FHP6_9HYME|nr:hypothetical protein PV328_010425 [Microctonus aethiopoides]